MVSEPIVHKRNCDYHADQYPWECTCGATEKMSYSEWILRRAQKLKDAPPKDRERK